MSGSVLVVGAGVAGRAAAHALSRRGLPCTVVERRAPDGLGMAVNLPGNAVRALADLGVADQVLADGVPVRRREYRNQRGRLLFAVDDARFWHGVGQPVCLRHGHLLAALEPPADAVLVRARAVRARPTGSGVEVELEGESSTRRFDLVIGADGVRSAMRAVVAQDAPSASAMTTSCWRFVGPDPGVGCWTAWSGTDVTVLLVPVAVGQVYGYVARTRGGPVGTDRAWLERATAGFPTGVRAAVEQALAAGELHHSEVDEVRPDRWYRGRLVLVGDAAHATGPVWAQGVALALEDALVLGGLLARTPAAAWGGVGAELERRRRPRVRHVQSVTDRMSRLAALPGLLRDAVAPVLGPRTYRDAYAPLRELP